MFENPEAYNLKKIFIPAYMHFPGDGEIDEKTGIQAPSFFDIKTGLTDQERALQFIMDEREIARKSKISFIKHCQNYPIKESDIFVKSSGGLLDGVKLHAQYMSINEGLLPKQFHYRKGRLEWVADEKTKYILRNARNLKEETKIHVKRGSKLRWIDDEEGTIERIADPINTDDMYIKPDIAGCDSYDEEADEDRSSDGATVVYRTYSGPSRAYNLPIALLSERGDSSDDDTFWCNNVKMAIYFNYELLFEYSKIAIERYFKDVGCENRLKGKPDLRDYLTKTSKAKNEYGQRMTPDVKNLGTKLLKQEVNTNCGSIWFEKIILDLMDFGDKNTDIAMAYMLVLLYKLELFGDITEDIESDENDVHVIDEMSYWDVDENGELIVRTYIENELNMKQWDPLEDLNHYERQEYLRQKQNEEQLLIERKNEIEKISKNSAEYFVQQELKKQGILK